MVLLLIFKGSFLMVVVAAGAVAELAAWEYLSLADAFGARTPRALVMLAIALEFLAVAWRPGLELPMIGVCSLALFTFCAFHSPLERVLPDVAFSVFCLLYIGLALTMLPLLWIGTGGPSLLVFLFCVVWSGDVAAMYAGRAFGRRKLAPRISPKKTWEGAIASMAGSLLIAPLLYLLGHRVPAVSRLAFPGGLSGWLFLAALLNVAAQVGDLVESAIKRGSGVKDSGTMLPGHGGILDRIDALLLAAPALWYLELARRSFLRH